MGIIIVLLVGIVAGMHLYFMWMEMFAWTTVGKRTFKMMDPSLFEKTKLLAANQGLYNGFLAVGLLWSLLITDIKWSQNVGMFFLSCVVVAGLYGWYTVSYRLFVVQGLPALIALILLGISSFQ
jgi:putative membrane protein